MICRPAQSHFITWQIIRICLIYIRACSSYIRREMRASHPFNFEPVNECLSGVYGALRYRSGPVSPRCSELKFRTWVVIRAYKYSCRDNNIYVNVEAHIDLLDPVPVNHDALGVELVGELDVDSVTDPSPNGGARELAIDPHDGVLDTVGRPEHVLDVPFEVPGLGTQRRVCKYWLQQYETAQC